MSHHTTNTVLNPGLYDSLVQAVRNGALRGRTVEVINRGQRTRITKTGDRWTRTGSAGETYKVCCPGCRDSRYRLYIDARWTEPDCGWMICCQNEHCENIPGFRASLRERLKPYVGRRLPGTRQGIAGQPHRDGPLPLPGNLYPVGGLPDDHHARQFLAARGYDPVELSEWWGVSYCAADRSQANNRIVAPITMGGIYRGYQARWPGDVANLWRCGDCGHIWQTALGELSDGADTPTGRMFGPGRIRSRKARPAACPLCREDDIRAPAKWWTAPGTLKGQMVYGLDQARAIDAPVVVIVEGPADAWRIGPSALAIFGHHLSAAQAELVAENFKLALVALDDDVPDLEVAAMVARLQAKGMKAAVMRVTGDPGDHTRDELWNMITDHYRGM